MAPPAKKPPEKFSWGEIATFVFTIGIALAAAVVFLAGAGAAVYLFL